MSFFLAAPFRATFYGNTHRKKIGGKVLSSVQIGKNSSQAKSEHPLRRAIKKNSFLEAA
jgi:hypothetical protein